MPTNDRALRRHWARLSGHKRWRRERAERRARIGDALLYLAGGNLLRLWEKGFATYAARALGLTRRQIYPALRELRAELAVILKRRHGYR